MESANELSTKNFYKYLLTVLSIGIVLFAAIYFGKKYKTSQKTEEIISFYNQFTDEEYVDFAKKLETAIKTNNPELFDNSMNVASFLNFSARELTNSYHKRRVMEVMGSVLKIGSIINDQIYHSDDFKFTRFYKENGIPHIVFRIYRFDFLNFMDFTVGIQNNSLVLNDSYNFFSGITTSQMTSDIYTKSISENQDAFSSLAIYEKVQYKLQSYEYEEAYDLLATIPAKNRDAIYYQILLIATANFDDEYYKNTIEEVLKLNPNDQKLHSFLNFQKSILKGDLDQLNTAIEKLEKYVGEDAIFDLYRGIIHYDSLEYDTAITYFDGAITKIPDFYHAYFYKLYTLLLQEKTTDALSLVATINDRFFVSEEDFTSSLLDFPDFTSSTTYKSIFQ